MGETIGVDVFGFKKTLVLIGKPQVFDGHEFLIGFYRFDHDVFLEEIIGF